MLDEICRQIRIRKSICFFELTGSIRYGREETGVEADSRGTLKGLLQQLTYIRFGLEQSIFTLIDYIILLLDIRRSPFGSIRIQTDSSGDEGWNYEVFRRQHRKTISPCRFSQPINPRKKRINESDVLIEERTLMTWQTLLAMMN